MTLQEVYPNELFSIDGVVYKKGNLCRWFKEGEKEILFCMCLIRDPMRHGLYFDGIKWISIGEIVEKVDPLIFQFN